MKYYHATPESNLNSIINDRYIKRGIDGCVYLCTEPKDALKFMAIRGLKEAIVFEVDELDLDSQKLYESYDHSESFFQCKAYCYSDDIDIMFSDTIKVTRWNW